MSNHRTVLTGLAFWGCLALTAPPVGSAQAPPPRRQRMPDPGRLGRGQLNLPNQILNQTGIPGQLDAPIPGKPFTATAEVTYGQGRTSTVQLARDTDGRTYLKAMLPLRPLLQPAAGSGGSSANSSAQLRARRRESVIVIADPVARRQYVLFPAAKNIEVHPLHRWAGMLPIGGGGSRLFGGGRMALGRSQAVTTTLGTEPVAGQPAAGLKTVRYIPARGNQAATTVTREVWRSPSLQLVLKASNTGVAGRKTSFAVQSLHLGAPEAALFQLPAGYTLEAAPTARSRRGAGSGTWRQGFRGDRIVPVMPPPRSGGQ